MNAKKAKKLRALVRQLQDKGVVREDWATTRLVTRHDRLLAARTESVALDPSCGRAVYQQMKKRDTSK